MSTDYARKQAELTMECPAETALKEEYAAVRRVEERFGLAHPPECLCHGTGRVPLPKHRHRWIYDDTIVWERRCRCGVKQELKTPAIKRKETP